MRPKTYTNLPPVGLDPTYEYFKTYFDFDTPVSENEYSAILSYFESRADNSIAASALAIAVITSSLSQGVSPMQVLDRFRQLSQRQIDAYIATFVNQSRIPTSLVGISNIPVASKYFTRAIRV
jgi:uncharacterized protein (DUF433 family)